MAKVEEKAPDQIYKCGLLKLKSFRWKTLISYKSLVVVLSSLLLGLLGSAAHGDILFFGVLLWKNWDQFRLFSSATESLGQSAANVASAVNLGSNHSSEHTVSSMINNDSFSGKVGFLESHYLKDVHSFIWSAMIISFVVFFGVGGFLQWKYYVRQRSNPKDWKCQPNRFLTKENERHEILLGSICLICNSTLSGVVTCYVYNGGKLSKVFYDMNDYGWMYFIFSTVVYFMLLDAFSYYYHRMLHWPFFYRNFHKMHHRYHSPTAFSAVALHPLEGLLFQSLLILPMFLVPVHYLTVMGCSYYLYYFGLVDHSGIDLDSIWPWQPPVRFHDDHHKYFHVNFGFNTTIFDRFHGTLRRKDREYGVNIFGGKGRALKARKD